MLQRWLSRHGRVSAWILLIKNVAVIQGESRASLAAAGAAFWLVIALFPAVIAAVSIFGLVVTPQRVAQALSDLGGKGTGSLGEAISNQAQQMADTTTSSLSLNLVISLVVLLWTVSVGSYNLTRAVRLSFGLSVRSYFVERLRGVIGGILGVLTLGVVALVASEMTALTSQLSGFWQAVIQYLVVVPVVLLLVLAVLIWLYKFSIGRTDDRIRHLPGAVLATIGLAGLAIVLSLAIAGFGSTKSVYGVAASSISALISVYTAIYIILLGAIVNAYWRSESTLTPVRGSPLTTQPHPGPADRG